MTTSILICTYNRGSLIDKTLHCLIKRQTVKPNEIVVVNGGGENNCKDTLQKWKNNFTKLKIKETQNINLAVSRNIGLSICQGDLVLFTDDDARPYPDWIEKIKKAYEMHPDAFAIGGNVVDISGDDFLSRIAEIATFPYYKNNSEVRHIPGVNVSYKKEVINHIGEFDETLFRGEDVDYNWRIYKKGLKLLFISDVLVKHIHRSTWKSLFYQHYMYGRAYYLVREKWPDMYSLYPSKIDSIFSIFKWFASWLWFPLIDAYHKSCRMKGITNGFELIIFYLINLSNRVGIFIQKLNN